MLDSKLKGINKSLRMLNNGSNILYEILEEGEKGRSMKGIGFNYKNTNPESQSTKMDFVAPKKQTEFKQTDFQMSNPKSQHVVQHVNTQVRSFKNATWRCHYCGRFGHIRPYCFKLYGYPQIQAQPKGFEKECTRQERVET